MALTPTPKIGLGKHDDGDLLWGTAIRDNMDLLDSELTKSGVGDPTGSVAGTWVGQIYFDTQAKILWVCTVTGVAASAVWQSQAALSGTANPNTATAGFLGQQYYETDRNTWWTCTVTGSPGTWTQDIEQGFVQMWAGLTTAIPSGWALCDGSIVDLYQTPDLSGRFIVGHDVGDAEYNTTDPVGSPQTGGAKTIALVEAETPPHSHSLRGSQFNGAGIADDNTRAANGHTTASFDVTLTPTETMPAATAHENRPNYYVLAYIAKT